MTPHSAGRRAPNERTFGREVVAIFDSADGLERAISALGSAGWDRAEMSLLAHKDAIGGPAGGARNLDAKREPVLSETDVRQSRTLAAGVAGVVAAFTASGATIMAGGTALAAVVGAVAAAGGVTAAVDAVGQILGEKRGRFLESQIERGGIVLWLSLGIHHDERLAKDILRNEGAIDVYGRSSGES